VWKYVDIQSPTAEIRRGKKKIERRNHMAKNITSASATQGGHNKEAVQTVDIAGKCI